jgi:hypothetical protein
MRDDSWRLRFFAAMSIVCLALLVFSAVCSAQITIEGPARVDVGQEAVFDVQGTPQPDDNAKWSEAFAWAGDMEDHLDVPEDSRAIARLGFVLDLDRATRAVYPRLQVKTVPDRPGVYFLEVIYWPDRARAVHRFTAGPVVQPPPPVPDKTFAERLKPPADPATAKELITNYQQILSLWQAAPAVTDAITGGKPAWEPFRVTMRTISGPADLQAAITVLEGVK